MGKKSGKKKGGKKKGAGKRKKKTGFPEMTWKEAMLAYEYEKFCLFPSLRYQLVKRNA